MKRQASLNYLNKQIWNLKFGSENGTLHRRIVVSSDQPIMDWAKTSLMLRDEKSLYALGVVVASKNGVKKWCRKRRRTVDLASPKMASSTVASEVASHSERGVVEVAPKVASKQQWRRQKASSTGVVDSGVVERRRRKASSTMATSNGIKWRRMASNGIE